MATGPKAGLYQNAKNATDSSVKNPEKCQNVSERFHILTYGALSEPKFMP